MEKELPKQRIVLDNQGMSKTLNFNKKWQILLFWKEDVDLDLMLFYKTVDDKEGGVFDSAYNNNRESLGSLDKFPFIMQYGCDGHIPGFQENWDEIIVKKIDDSIREMYILIVSYESADENSSVNYASYKCRLIFLLNEEYNLEIPVNSPTKGIAYVICKIENSEGDIKIINESKCVSLEDAYNNIPGFKLICIN